MGIFPLHNQSRHYRQQQMALGKQLPAPVQPANNRIVLPLLLACLTVLCLLWPAVATWSASNEPFQRMTSSELKTMMDRQEQDLAIIDSRSPGEYQEAHIRGAVNIPLSTQERSPQALSFPKGAKLVFYCNGFT